MVDCVIAALEKSSTEGVYAVTSPNAPATVAHLDVPTVKTAGEGYVADLQTALADARIDEPVLTVAADVPLIDAAVVDEVLDRWDDGSLTATVPVEAKRDLGVSVDTSFVHDGREVAPTGVNVVGGNPERVAVIDDGRLAVNVNRDGDLAVARSLADAGNERESSST